MSPVLRVEPCIGPDNGFPPYSIEALILSHILFLPTENAVAMGAVLALAELPDTVSMASAVAAEAWP